MEKILVAVPSNNPGGLEAGMGMHFGHCDIYTLVEMENGAVKSVSTMENGSHEEGGCLVPVQRLAERKVNVLLSGGMGMRPLNGFMEAGIDVFHSGLATTVGAAVQAFAEGKLQKFSADATCKGCH
ncbi:NifB/NifX family molybdenum-iron cluster-binding protein [Desulfovibrio sp. OttesenSCG-928-C06]|nr:NifB/NifX family molybdenum-iron cluster-binding protein [Desulfovibrio sp. OttesenSCG-928-C06]